MSISSIQYKKVLHGLSKYYFSSGKKPTDTQLMKDIGRYFSNNSIGFPILSPRGIFAEDLTASAESMNLTTSTVIANLDLLYESTAEQLEQNMYTTTYLNSQLERLRLKRKALVDKIDEYLFTTSNADGYFYSFADSFTDIDNTDLSLTSSFVDVLLGSVTLPVNSDRTKVMPGTQIRNVDLNYYVDGVEVRNGFDRAPFAGCTDGLSNTIWHTEVVSDKISEVLCTIDISVGFSVVSKIEYDPYGISPIQIYVETADNTLNFADFGSFIEETTTKVGFSSNSRAINNIRFTIKKTKPDYTVQTNAGTNYTYIFGAKNISIIQQAFDYESTWVSKPIAIDPDMSNENVLDSISLKVEDSVPEDTRIEYFVALDTTSVNESISDFDWKKIVPLDELDIKKEMIINFSGSSNINKFIRSIPEKDDFQLIAKDDLNPDSRKRNPFAIEGIDVWRIIDFQGENPIPLSMRLEEGVNSLRVFYAPFRTGALELSYWRDYVLGNSYSDSVITRIDTGNNFFWGGDIGENYKSVYMETYLDSPSSQNLDFKKFVKLDDNSKLWDVRVFLNGAQVADLPVGTDSAIIPWSFKEGLNHIAITASIPRSSSSGYPNEGALELMDNDFLHNYGSVKLSNWNYVDLFQLLNNDSINSRNFSLYTDGENTQLVSRKKPSDNLRIRYSTPNSATMQRVRVRADLKRSVNDPSVSPSLNSYKVRFRYA